MYVVKRRKRGREWNFFLKNKRRNLKPFLEDKKIRRPKFLKVASFLQGKKESEKNILKTIINRSNFGKVFPIF